MSYVLPTYARFPISLVKGEASYVYDTEGKRYIDCCAGIATCSLGHCHPALVTAISEQAATLMHCSNLYGIPQQEELAELIVKEIVGVEGKIFFCNSGAEANEGIIKTARRYGHRHPAADGSPRYEIITFNQSFHGRTLGAMAATGQRKIQIEFDPLLTGFRYVDFNDSEALKTAIGPQTCGIMLEAIQGEGGVNPATAEFLASVKELCQAHDLLLMMDEVQCGFARCGSMMGWQAIDTQLNPDLISCAKGMGGGFPIGCFYVSDRAIDNQGTSLSSIMGAGSHGSTFGGTPLACATSLAVVKQILADKLEQRAAAMGQLIEETVMSWGLEQVTCVRGLGLLRGIGLNTQAIKTPEGSTAAAYLTKLCMDAGLLICPAGTETLRLIPALTIDESVLQDALCILRKVISEA